VSENERVRELVRILRAASVDRTKLGELFFEGHASLRDDYEASTAELDRLVELAFDHGATAARMTGGGFGGSMLALVERDAAHDFGETVAAAYQRTAGEAPAVRICTATGAAREVT
jgi:galactokinase